ncbi:hypothetical protein DITRI_Ditri01bG0151200 [Diplodiscus trichospermus]
MWRIGFGSTIWSIWTARNEIVFRGRRLDIGHAGIGGILRDHGGYEKLRFSKCIGVEDSNVAELLANREAFMMFLASRWNLNKAIIIENDSTNVVKWILNPNTAPWRVRNIINHIKKFLKSIGEWKIVHLLRECNLVADLLAKEGPFGRIVITVSHEE